jgi:serine/threonine-protein kinase PknK
LAVVVLSAHIELEEAKDLLGQGARTAYLLKSRVIDVDQFVDTLHRVVEGESVLDPEIVEQLVRPRRASDPLDVLSPREHEVLALMAEGRSNSGIAHRLYVSEGTVEKHVRAILMKLDIIDAADDHRRVLAVLQYLEAR